MSRPGGRAMSKDENQYSKKQALKIHDESIRFQRQVRNGVLTSGGVVAMIAVFYGLFMLTQQLQRGNPATVSNPDIVMLPATGTTLSTAFGALLAVILGVWFSPNTFRLGRSESPTTIARELATQSTIVAIARICTLLSLAVGAWAFISATLATAPQQVDVIRTIVPALIGFGLAWWAAAAEVRVAGSPIRRLQWAQRFREALRVRGIIDSEVAPRLSRRALLSQRFLAFAIVPVIAWGLGVLIVPAPNLGATVARLVTTVAIVFIAYYALRNFVYCVIGGQLWAACSVMGAVAMAGIVLASAAAAAALPTSSDDDVFELAPLGRSVLLFSVVTLSIPFLLLAVLAFRRLFGRSPGLIYDAVMRRYDREFRAANDKAEELVRNDTDDPAQVPIKTRFAWASIAAIAPVPPFNFMFAALALRQTRGGNVRGKGVAIVAIVLGILLALVVTGVIIYAAWSNPALVFCEPRSKAVCFRAG